MEKFLELRHVAGAAKKAGLDEVERRSLTKRGDDYINEVIKNSHPEKMVREDSEEEYYAGESVYATDKFFDFMEKGAGDNRAALDLGAVMRKYGSKEKRSYREKLSADEGRLISVAVKYFEDWFYRGDFLRSFEREQERENYYAISAFIVNQLAKIKELQENSGLIEGFNSEKLEQLISDVSIFAEKFLTEENLNMRIQERTDAIKELENELRPMQAMAVPFDKKTKELKNIFEADYAKIQELLERSDSLSGLSVEEKEALQSLRVILKQCDKFNQTNRQTELESIQLGKEGSLLQALRRRIDDLRRFEDNNEKIASQKVLDKIDKIEVILKNRFKSSEESSKQKTKEKPKKISGFEALGGLKESIRETEITKLLEGLVGDPYIKTRNTLKEQYKLKDKMVDEWEINRKKYAIESIGRELQRACELFHYREKIKQVLASSIESVTESLKRPAGDLYLLKTIIIATAEQASHNKNKKFPDFLPDTENWSAFDSRADSVFDFNGSYRRRGNEGNGGYMKVHFEPAHLSFAQFAVEMMRSKKREP